MGLEEFIKAEYPDVWQHYQALTDPNYFQVGKEYQPMVSGYQGSGKRYRTVTYLGLDERGNAAFDNKPQGGFPGGLNYSVQLKNLPKHFSKPIVK